MPPRSLSTAMLSLALVLACYDKPDNGADGGTGTDTGTGTAATDESTTGAAAPSCAEYCSLVGDHCDAEFPQYSGESACLAACAAIPPGTDADELGNTIGCRIHHSILAGEQTDPHCFHAGPGGDGVCGGNCEGFCTMAQALCTDDLAVWPDIEACVTDCGTFATDPPYTSDVPDADTLACRIKHLMLAALQPGTHCPHLPVDSPVCM